MYRTGIAVGRRLRSQVCYDTTVSRGGGAIITQNINHFHFPKRYLIFSLMRLHFLKGNAGVCVYLKIKMRQWHALINHLTLLLGINESFILFILLQKLVKIQIILVKEL